MLVIDDLIILYLTYKLGAGLFGRLNDYLLSQYRASLQDYLKKIRLAYEEKRMSEEEYRRREAETMQTLKGINIYLKSRQVRSR